MRADETLSTGQWNALQALFERALAGDAQERRSLVDRSCAEDPMLGQALAAMLAAHEQWQGRTDSARDDWQRRLRDSANLAEGESIGPYRILGVLGQGGMGVVYRAERADGEVTLTAAIKVLHQARLDAPARERFQRERDLLAGLNHLHIARLFDAGVSVSGQPYFVMEYVRGATIVRHCDARHLDVRARLRLFLDVCDAVRYAHNQLVLHRDIKASNVLVDEAGVAKLIDFGIARTLVLNDEQVAATVTAHRFFSPMNVAPEQLRGERMGVACDVYQLGTLLYELLCGRPIFALEDKTLGAIEQAIFHEIPVAPSARVKAADATVAQTHGCADVQALARQLSGDLDEIILMAVRKEPERRYASVEQLIEDIERHLDLRPVRARGSHRGYQLSRFVRRHWSALGLTAAAALAVIAFVTMLGIQSRELQRERDRAVGQQHRAEQEERRAEETTRFLVGVFKAADPTVSMNRDTPIGEVLENGRRRIDVELSDQPQLKADLMFALAGIYADIESFPEAQKYARQSLALRESLMSGSMSLAESLGQLAVIDAAAGDCKGTTQAGPRALDLYRKLGTGVAKSLDVQAEMIRCQAHEKGGAYGRDRMLALLDVLKHDPEATPPQIARQEEATAEFMENMADVEGALRLSQSAVERLDQGVWKYSSEALRARKSLANSQSEVGQFDLAKAEFDRLVPDYARIFGSNSVAYALVLEDRGANYYSMQRYRDAEADWLETKRIQDSARPGLHDYQALTASNLGDLYRDALKDMPKAGIYLEEAARIAGATLGPHDLTTLELRAEWVEWLAKVGRTKEAEPELRALLPELPITITHGIGVRLTLAEILAQSGRRAEAKALVDACEPVIAAHPHFVDFVAAVARIRKTYGL